MAVIITSYIGNAQADAIRQDQICSNLR